MRIHFIAIGGAAMHNLAIALHKKGYQVSGSDDEIFEPSFSRLKNYGLLPEKFGWFPEKINSNLDIIILGMHARKDNPELLRAQALNLKIYSYPEFLYEQTKNKKRVVIGGSHGKTSITSMIMHVLKNTGVKFDYMVGANIRGFDTMVNLEDKNEIAVFEGDEYLSSPLDLSPKFHWYKPDIAVLTGIAWDHINVFPSFGNYLEQFDVFIKTINKNGKLFWFAEDENLKKLVHKNNVENYSYKAFPHVVSKEGQTLVEFDKENYVMSVFGNHNMQNINAARLVCLELGIKEKVFWQTIQSFEGAAKRLQLVKETKNSSFYLDFAHAPSKLKATINAIKNKNPERKLIACIELHTFSSLQGNFIPQYKNTMDEADIAIVYYSHEVLKHKRLPELNENFVKESFGGKVEIFTNTDLLKNYLMKQNYENSNLLMMSSGNFNGIDFVDFANKLI
ncbi:MAG: peptidoglycan synthetase [Bacteroidales bacterium]|jgi:UDP-N-acetylmuramate: L-alanyl-gamma-D-glutamyl-meso-diaminopimelate ligase|nr:Mur ligase family protein [Bacteroidales bacterium]NLB87320.1 peptidoglycan synthetase [Bacteroidales bacterium]